MKGKGREAENLSEVPEETYEQEYMTQEMAFPRKTSYWLFPKH